MSYNDKLKMDADAVRTVAENASDLQLTLATDVKKAVDELKFEPKIFGGTEKAKAVAGELKGKIDPALQQAFGKAAHFMDAAAQATAATARAQTMNEEDAKWGFDKLGKGL